MTQASRRLPVTALAACVLGIVVCPVPYVVLAARAELSPTALATAALPFMLGATILLKRFLTKPTTGLTRGLAMRLIELASWIAVVSFLLFISQIHLLRGLQRWGGSQLVLPDRFTLLSAVGLGACHRARRASGTLASSRHRIRVGRRAAALRHDAGRIPHNTCALHLTVDRVSEWRSPPARTMQRPTPWIAARPAAAQ